MQVSKFFRRRYGKFDPYATPMVYAVDPQGFDPNQKEKERGRNILSLHSFPPIYLIFSI